MDARSACPNEAPGSEPTSGGRHSRALGPGLPIALQADPQIAGIEGAIQQSAAALAQPGRLAPIERPPPAYPPSSSPVVINASPSLEGSSRPRSPAARRRMSLSWRSQGPAAAVVLLAVACALLLRSPASPAAPAASGGAAQAAAGRSVAAPEQVRC